MKNQDAIETSYRNFKKDTEEKNTKMNRNFGVFGDILGKSGWGIRRVKIRLEEDLQEKFRSFWPKESIDLTFRVSLRLQKP